MKALGSMILVVLVACGCSTTSSVARKEGKGTCQVYRAPFDQVWRAAIDGTQLGDLEILTANQEHGYISAKRGLRMETFGEDVGVWVKRLSPTETQVEVVSRQAGPPKSYLKNWENEIHGAIAANLTREAVGSGGTGATSGTVSGASSNREELRTDAQHRIAELRQQEQSREDALAAEQSTERRGELQDEIERLRSERRVLEDYLLDLELERR